MSKRRKLFTAQDDNLELDDALEDDQARVGMGETMDLPEQKNHEQQEDNVRTEHPTIEEHAAALGTPDWALAGTKVRERWVAQQRVERQAFERAVERFLSGPTDGMPVTGGE